MNAHADAGTAVGNATTPIYITQSGYITAGTALGASAYHADSYFALASHGNHVPATQTANNLTFLRNDNNWYKLTKNEVNALINLLDTGSSPLTTNDYVITQYVGGGTTTTTYHRRPASKVVNETLVKAALGTVGTTAKKFLKDTGDWTQVDWGDLTGKPSSFTPSSHTHYELSTIADNRNDNTTPNDYKNRFIFQGLKYNNKINSPYTDTYSYLIGLRGWSDNSGGNAHEFAFNGNGVYRRQGQTTEWGDWLHLLDSGNTTAPSTVPILSWNTESTVFTLNGSAVKIKAMAQPSYAFTDLTSHPTTLSGYGITNAVQYNGVDNEVIGGSASAAGAKNYWADNTKVPKDTIVFNYNSSGTEYTTLFSNRNNQYGTILKWSYTDTYIRILRAHPNKTTYNGWYTEDWEKISAGYADSAGKATNDVDGNAIKTTYAKLGGAAFTGTVTVQTPTADMNPATKKYVDNILSANNAMTFKGTLGTDGTVTTLPDSHTVGDTYRVITAGDWAGKTCVVGDLIICTNTGTTANNADWTSVETNEDGAVIGPAAANSTTNNAIVRWDSTVGRVIKNSGVTIDNNNNIYTTGILETGRYFHNVATYSCTNTPKEILIKTKIPFANSAHMPKIIIHMYNYSDGLPTEIGIVFYIYNDAFCNMGITSNTKHRPKVTLCTYTESDTKYVGIGLGLADVSADNLPHSYYIHFNVDYLDIWPSVTRTSLAKDWTITGNTSTTSIIPTTDRKNPSYVDQAQTARQAAFTSNQWGISYYSDTAGTFASTGAGTSGQYLKSNGNSAPTWATFPTTWTPSSHTHGDITNDGKLANANRLVWTDNNKKIYAGYHFANSTKIAINSYSEPTENLYVSGTSNLHGTTSIYGNTFIYGNTIRIRNANNDNNQAGSNPYITSLMIGDSTYVAFNEFHDDWLAIQSKGLIFNVRNSPITVYDATKTYAVGAVVWYDKNYYICKTAIETAEAWNANHWTIRNPSGAILSEASIIPWSNNTYTLGNSSYKWNDIYTTTLNTGYIKIPHTAGSSTELQITYSTTIDYWWGVGTANVNHGMYDNKANKWIISAAADNQWSFDGNAGTATTLQNARTLWGQSFDGSANVTGNLIDVGNQIKLLSGQTELQFLTSSGGAANGKFGKLGLNTTYANVDFTNYILDVNGKARIGALDGGQHVINGNVQLNAQSGYYNEGLRINRSTTGYANIYLGGTRNSASGNERGGWWIGTLSTPVDATSDGDTITNTVFTISNNSTADTLSIKGTRGATIGTNSGWAIKPRLTIGTTYDTNYTLKVAGMSWLQGPLRIGNADTAGTGTGQNGYATDNSGSTNYIAFYGVYGDNPGSFNHTYIGESIYGPKDTANEKSELLLFKGNDVNATTGPDRIRLFANQVDIQVYETTLSGTWDTIRATTGTQVANFAKGKVTINGDVYPINNNTQTLGTSTNKWNLLYTTLINQAITGTGTVGSYTNSTYYPAKWTFNTGKTAQEGDMVTIKLPCAGHDYGVFMSIDNGANYYPVVVSGTGRVTTHYPNGSYITVIFNGAGSAADMFPLAGQTSSTRITVSGGVWQVLNYYDSGNSGLHQNYNPKSYKVGSTAITAYDLIAEDINGYLVPAHKIAHRVGSPIFIRTAALAANAASSWGNFYDRHYSLTIRKDGNNLSLTTYAPVFLKGTISAGIFTPDTTTPFISTKANCNVSGAYYMYIGDATGATTISFNNNHPYYYYNGSNLLLYTEQSENADIATTATYLGNIGRQTNMDIDFGTTTYNSKFFISYADGSTTTNKPYQNAMVLNIAWDNVSGNKYGAQIAIGNSTTPHLQLRGCYNGTWDTTWATVLDSSNYTTYAVAKTAGVTAVTWDATNKKLTRTINGTAADVMTAAQMSAALGVSSNGSTTKWLNEKGSWTTPTASDVGAAPSSTVSCTTANVKTALGISSSGSETKWLNEKGSWVTPTASDIGAAPAVTGGYLPLSGGTMTGVITLATGGLKTNNAAGYTINQYGNFQHQRNTNTDTWNIVNNAGTNTFGINFETGAATANGKITAAGGFNGNLEGNASSADTATTAKFIKFSAGNEIRFDIDTKPTSATDIHIGFKWSDATGDAKINGYKFCNGNGGNLAKVYASEFVGPLNGNASTASKITNMTTNDAASNSDVWRRIWISYSNNVEGRPAYTDNFCYQTSTNTLKAGKYLINSKVRLEYNTTDDSLDFVFI